jgi:hypothetical protein
MYTKWIGSSCFQQKIRTAAVSKFCTEPSFIEKETRGKFQKNELQHQQPDNIFWLAGSCAECKTLLPKVQINFYVYMFSIRLKVVKFNEAG